MPVRKAQAVWEKSLKDGNGMIELESGLLKAPYSFSSRFKSGKGTNPEELIAAAHAGCFSMALSLMLTEEGFTPDMIETEAKVKIEKVNGGFKITHIELNTECKVPEIEEAKFKEIAMAAKDNCPVSKALAGTEISLKSKLK